MVTTLNRPRARPLLFPQLCKACGRCVTACPTHCIELGSEIDPVSGLTSVIVHEDECNGCGLCFDACPEPYGLWPRLGAIETVAVATTDPYAAFGATREAVPDAEFAVEAPPERRRPLGRAEPLILKGTEASAIGALLAGCRHFFGYPITPSTEGAELMAALLPQLNGVFLQAVSEVATVNMMYGCGGAGLRSMTFTSSPGFSLMLEGISYMIGAELPGVFVDVMRGGPGLGNIGPEQGDIKLACRGLGHGNTHAIVLAPADPQEMLDLTMEAFGLAFRYRNPVVLLADGYLGQVTGRVRLPAHLVEPHVPGWAVWGDAAHRRNLISSTLLDPFDLETHNLSLNAKYARMDVEQRAELYGDDDPEWLLVACNTPARMARGAVHALRSGGIRAGLFRPITLWPFPTRRVVPLLGRARGLVMVEAGPGQLEDELRLALSIAGVRPPTIQAVRHHGGVLPTQREIVDRVIAMVEATGA
jgi:pyruvate/2-oxoacid:ferredoxin oxidoreductase alpha subunit/NAD-dependent dihydropyrimidine dehydrogenase PreA subunit